MNHMAVDLINVRIESSVDVSRFRKRGWSGRGSVP
jgi:hypothetical protein